MPTNWYEEPPESYFDPQWFTNAVEDEARFIFDPLGLKIILRRAEIVRGFARWRRLIGRYETLLSTKTHAITFENWLVSYFSLLFYVLNKSDLVESRRHSAVAGGTRTTDQEFCFFATHEVLVSSFCVTAFKTWHFYLTGRTWARESTIGRDTFVHDLRSKDRAAMHLFLALIGVDTMEAKNHCPDAA